jgi:quinoprotein relay system zinc metallohydrolase 2
MQLFLRYQYLLAGMAFLLFLQGQEALGAQAREIASGIYLRSGVQEEFSINNQGHIANIGFIVGTERVAVIDTGSSYHEGLTLRRMIAETTDLPIAYVVLTHMHPDHSLGAAAFDQDNPIYVGHEQLSNALVRRQTVYLDRMRQILGSGAEGTRMVFPSLTVAVNSELTLDLGGRSLVLRAYPTAHTNNDMSVYDDQTGTLWLSDLLFVERIPVVDGSLLGWLKVIEELDSNACATGLTTGKRDSKHDKTQDVQACGKVERVVPGHGPVVTQWKKALADQRHYLQHIASGIREIIAKGGTINQAVAKVGWEERDKWLLFREYHGRNITAGFAELEWE